MAKDALIFRPGKVQGVCRYPPHEERDAELEKIHRHFSLHPMGLIRDYPRHIPYASDKKTFQEKTGRDSFHVFQYTFRIPGDDKEWHVMWDYNIGIVRITHLFKCNGYSKANHPGITGGALSAQGYWMPYDAAKAMAATFCWKIRFALTPLFGTDFPGMCIHPTDRKNYGRMVIPQEIVQRATKTANYYRSLELSAGAGVSPSASMPSPTRSLINTRLLTGEETSLALDLLKMPRHRYAESSPSGRESSTEPYCMSPKSLSPFSNFTPINPPRSSDVPPPRVESPQSIIRAISDAIRPENPPGPIGEESDMESDSSSNMYSTPNCPSVDGPPDAASDLEIRQSDYDDTTDSDDDWQVDDANDEDYRGPSLKRSPSGYPIIKNGSTSRDSQSKKNPSRKSRPVRAAQVPHFAREVKAAEALLRLHKNELESTDAQSEIDDDGLATPFGCRSLDGGAPGSRKRRRASL
ncbi:hypothetical protein N7457_007565 [Penicillium paradoxum]|uniref:uncharacterized protein n=1 Tax=Penicillium paradoxum TaxID=176176 RepID=UPI0025489360|nr:uncharacterized protein N7457_007565 [Penicillium paradoxum]KAJ5779845.1 hypothetical protein N7457_007565 [Penicillium paradoxum]